MEPPKKSLGLVLRNASWMGEGAPPAPATPEVPTEIKPEEVVIRLGDRRYRVRGLGKNMSYDVLRVNLLASRDDGFHVDSCQVTPSLTRLGDG